MAPPWKKSIGATPFDPAADGDSSGIPSAEALLNRLIEPQVTCPVTTTRGDAPDTKAKLNTMKSVMEIMAAVTRRPGMLASDAQRDDAIADLLRMIREEAEAFAPLVTTSSWQRPWITGQTTLFIAHLVAKQWVHQGNHDISELIVLLKTMFGSPEFNQFAHSAGDLDYHVTSGKEDAFARLNLSLSKVTSSIYYEVRRFSFYRDPQEVLAHVVKRVADAIQAEPAHRDVSADLRISSIQSRLGRLGELMASEYAETIDKAMEALIDTANADPKDFAPLKEQFAAHWRRHTDEAFDRAVKGYRHADALADQILARFQNDVRPVPTPTP